MLVYALTIIDSLKIKKDVIDNLVSQGLITPIYEDGDDFPKYELEDVLKNLKQEDKRERVIKIEAKRKRKIGKVIRMAKNDEKWQEFQKNMEEQNRQGINTESSSRLKFFHGEIVELLQEKNARQTWKIINDKLPDGFGLSYPSFLAYVNRYIRNEK
jgi:hypothetical protein